MADFDISLLRTFTSVVDSGGFSRASERVHRTQSTVSQQIKRLAADGYLELDPNKRISLTPKGKRIAEETYNRHNSLAEIFIWLGVNEQTAFEDACRIEHYISAETFNALRRHYETDRKNE